MPQPPTLSDLTAQGRNLVIGCMVCKRTVYIEGPEAVARFGPDRTLKGIQDIAKCSRCGAVKHGLSVDAAKPPKR